MTHTSRVRRTAAITSGALGLALATAAVAGVPASGADPTGDCTAPYDVSQLQRDDAVTGITVSSGTTPEPFTGTVIGTLEDGIAPGIDMIMIQFDSPALQKAGGIWQGMSGSPVYLDGKLVGAVAYGLAYGPSPIAGVTPFSQMDDYLSSTPAATVTVGKRQAERIAATGEVSRSQAAQGFAQLPMPMTVSGLSSTRTGQLSAVDAPWNRSVTYAAGRAGRADVDASTIVAGGNVAASAAYGDVSFAGVGTVTSVCNGRVVAFGHPFSNLGATSLGLHPADALYVQPDSLGSPFKVANIGAPVGTIDQDRRTGITGAFGTTPDATVVSSTVTAEGRERTGTTDVYVDDALASATFGEFVANHDRVFDTVGGGREDQSWTITGTENGTPFSLTWSDTYVDKNDITFGSAFELADFVYGISGLDGVTVDSVAVTSDVTRDTSQLKLTGIEQRAGSGWRAVTRKAPAIAKPGKDLLLRAVLTGAAGTSYQEFSVAVPTGKLRGGSLSVLGGSFDYIDSYSLTSIADAQAELARALRNDQIGISARFNGRNLAVKKSTTKLSPLPTVVVGQKSIEIVGPYGRAGGPHSAGDGAVPSPARH